MCYQSWNQLQLSEFLVSQGFSENQAQLAATQVISRAVYPASELKTTSWIQQNSGVCELTGYKIENLTKDKLYQSALALQQIAPALQSHLSQRTNSLFNLEDKIILYDLTNTYFEGSMRQSELAQYGRSKEKRNDAKLIVLAMVVNVEGFIKHTALHQGNIADCNTLKDTIKKIDSSLGIEKPIVVLDAGIATEENLTMLQTQGYKYVCVSRNKLKNYEAVSSKLPIILTTKGKQKIQIKAVHNASNTDYYFEVNSPKKAIKEIGMKNAFEKRFEEELQKIKHALGKKSGVKQIDKVNQRIGRAKQKYPSVQYYYNLELHNDIEKNIVLDITWSKNEELHKQKTETLGVYFLRTNMNLKEEKVVWDIYNTIREIESTFRTLKTDLDLRPIYHKSDAGAMAHLHLGIMAYWLVNTIRFQLKEKGIHSSWTEIVRIGNTQKMITTSGQNTYNKIISVRKCSEPNENLKQIYAALRVKTKPFKKIKSVVHKTTAKKIETPNYKPPQRL